MKQLKWTERKFYFGYGPEFLPYFIERLRTTGARWEELTRNVGDEKLSFQPGGNWSVKQHIGHLTDLEALHEGRLLDFLAKKEILRPADMENKVTYAADHNTRNVNDLISEMKTAREQFIKNVSEFSEEQLQIRSIHPRLKQEVNVVDILHFVAEHDLFHLTKAAAILTR